MNEAAQLVIALQAVLTTALVWFYRGLARDLKKEREERLDDSKQLVQSLALAVDHDPLILSTLKIIADRVRKS